MAPSAGGGGRSLSPSRSARQKESEVEERFSRGSEEEREERELAPRKRKEKESVSLCRFPGFALLAHFSSALSLGRKERRRGRKSVFKKCKCETPRKGKKKGRRGWRKRAYFVLWKGPPFPSFPSSSFVVTVIIARLVSRSDSLARSVATRRSDRASGHARKKKERRGTNGTEEFSLSGKGLFRIWICGLRGSHLDISLLARRYFLPIRL